MHRLLRVPKVVRKSTIFVAGIILAYWLNESLSIQFLRSPDLIFLLVGLPVVLVIGALSFWIAREYSWLEKLEILFFGCWVAFLCFGFYIFVVAVKSFVSAVTEPIAVRAWVTVNMLKSLFLSGVFNVLERMIRFLK